MQRTPEYQKLLDDHAALSKRPGRMLNLDESVSVSYYEAELAYAAGALDPRNQSLVARWTRNLHVLEDFAAANGFPRDNRRKPPESFTSEHRHLITWVNTQLRETSLGNRCNYQQRRLELIPGYIDTSRIDNWETQLTAYRDFVINSRGEQPRRRSNDSAERMIKNWQDRQRAAYRRGALSGEQIAALEATVLWTWD